MVKLKYIFILILLIVFKIYSQQGWFSLNSGGGINYKSIHFLNENTGFISGDNYVIKTTNGGLNWINFMVGGGNATSVYFTSSDTGYIASGNIFKTINGGINWVAITSLMYPHALSVHFIDSHTGFFVGGFFMSVSTAILSSTYNSGMNWSVNYVFNQATSRYITFINSSTGFIVGDNGKIFKTSNSGSTWYYVSNSVSNLLSLSFANLNTGFAIGPNAGLVTTNGGENWAGFPISGNSVFFTNNTGYIAGVNGNILKTTNSGLNWSVQISGVSENLLNIFFVNDSVGYAAGDRGTILKTRNGGYVGVNPIANELPSGYKLSDNYPNPFNPATNIKFQIPKSEFVKVIIYDALGKEVQTLVNEQLSPGTYSVDFDGSALPSGVYYYNLEAGEFTQTKKMVLIK